MKFNKRRLEGCGIFLVILGLANTGNDMRQTVICTASMLLFMLSYSLVDA